MKEIGLFVSGIPVPKQSFKKSAHGGYTPPRQKAWQEQVTKAVCERFPNSEEYPIFGTEQLFVSLVFSLPDNKRRDLDNLSKAVLDACNGILWKDDTQVYQLDIRKRRLPECTGVSIEVSDNWLW